MLLNLTRKLCPLMTLAMATAGCGKKISEAKSKTAFATENQQIPSTFIIRLDRGLGLKTEVKMPEDAQFKIPQKLKVISGQTANEMVEIAYDVHEYDDDDYLFKCAYVPSHNPTEMTLDKCVDYDNDDYGDVSEYTFPLKKNSAIQMRFTGAAAPDFVVEALYSMKWIIP